MGQMAELFGTFAKIGVCTFGGGYAMLPILQRELAERRGWVSEDELADYYAVGQCTPGVIAVNTATFVGNKRAGVAGGVVATLGLVFPSVAIILVVAAFLSNFMDLPWVVHAFNGVRAGVVALILNSVIRLFRGSVTDWPTRLIYAGVLILSAVGAFAPSPAGLAGAALGYLCSPVALVVLSGAAGLLVHRGRGGGRE